MPHERIPLTLNEQRQASPETALSALDDLPRPRQPRWAAAAADLIDGLRGVRTGDPLVLLAEAVAVAADAELGCVVGVPGDVPGGDAGAEESFVVHAAHDGCARQLLGLAFPAAGSVCGRAFDTGRPTLVGGGDRQAAGPESLLMPGRTLVLPVAGIGQSRRPALVLTASRPIEAPPFTAADLESAQDFGRLARAGLDLERSSRDRARRAVLADRDRIARELHDQVIQRIFAAGLTLQALGRMTTDPVLGRRLSEEVRALDAVIADLRTAIFALTQSHPDRPGVRRRLLDLLDELGPLFPHPPRVVFSGAVDLLVTAALADDVLAVVREGLTNVVRHARPRETEVRVSALEDVLTIEISDDGVGLSGSGRRSGIANLSARAQRRQGLLSLTEREPRGTLLNWTVCLTDASEGAAR